MRRGLASHGLSQWEEDPPLKGFSRAAKLARLSSASGLAGVGSKEIFCIAADDEAPESTAPGAGPAGCGAYSWSGSTFADPVGGTYAGGAEWAALYARGVSVAYHPQFEKFAHPVGDRTEGRVALDTLGHT